MTDLDQLVRSELHRVADAVTVPVLPNGATYRAAERRRHHPFLAISAAAAAVMLVIAGVVLVAAHRPTGIPPAQGGPAAWPTRGSLAGDTSLLEAAMRTWDAAPVPAAELPHHDVHALYAGSSVAGETVVLTGVDREGQRRIVWLNTNPTSRTAFRHRLHLVADVLAPDGNDTGLIGLYAWRPTPRPTSDYVVLGIGAPTTRDLQWADELHHWRSLPSRDGAGLEVVAAKGGLLDVTVRAGHDGHGIGVLGDVPLIIVQPTAIDYEGDPAPATAGANEHCDGSVCSGSATAGPFAVSASPDSNAWTDLAQPAVRTGNFTLDRWPEFAPEAQLMAQSLHPPTNGYREGAEWSSLLPDHTGLYLVNYTPGGEAVRLVLYVDRPDWYGGRST